MILSVLFAFALGMTYAQRPGGGRGNINRGNGPAIGVLTGKVVDKTVNKPVEYANIVVFSKRDSSMVTGTITNAKGEFRIEKLKFGRYYITADFIGYEKTVINEVRVTPKSNEKDLGTIGLNRATKQLDEVSVVADRASVDYKIDKKVINVGQQMTAAGGTAAEALENMPSVDVDIEGNVTLRGSSAFTVLIDGKPSVLDGSDALKQIPAEAIENIEIITNPSAKYEPDGTAGIINVILKKKKLEGVSGLFSVSAGTGISHSENAMVNIRTGSWNFVVGGSYSDRRFDMTAENKRQTFYDDKTEFLNNKETGLRKFGGYNFNVGADYSVNSNNTLSLGVSHRKYQFGRFSETDYHQFFEPVTDEEFYSNDNDLDIGGEATQITFSEALRYGKHLLDIVAVYQFTTSSEDNFSTTFDTDRDFVDEISIKSQNERDTESEGGNLRFKTDYTWKRNANSTFEVGYQLRWEQSDKDYMTVDFQRDLDETELVQTDEFDYERFIHAGYMTYSDSWHGFDMKVGLRAEYTDRTTIQQTLDEEYGYNSLDLFPSVYITRKLGKAHQLQLNYSRRINRPRGHHLNPYAMHSDAFSEFVGNPNLKPELSGSYELNYLYKFGKSYISLEAYYKQSDNEMTRYQELVADPDNPDLYITRSMYANLNSEKSIGAEVYGDIVLAKWFSFNPSATIYYFEIEDKTGDDVEIRSSNNYRFRLNTTFRFSTSSRLQLSGSYRSPSVSALGESEATYSMDVALRQDFLKRRASFTLRVRDVFQTRRREGYSEGEGFRTDYSRQRQAPFFMLSFSYKLNNFKVKRVEGEGFDGGIDMD